METVLFDAEVEFWSLVLADDQLFQAEFDELIAADSAVPPAHHRRSRGPLRPRPARAFVAEPLTHRLPPVLTGESADTRTRQRSPPGV
jgi:hypothetical protein